jgi:hypothetical protein
VVVQLCPSFAWLRVHDRAALGESRVIFVISSILAVAAPQMFLTPSYLRLQFS